MCGRILEESKQHSTNNICILYVASYLCCVLGGCAAPSQLLRMASSPTNEGVDVVYAVLLFLDSLPLTKLMWFMLIFIDAYNEGVDVVYAVL